MRPGMLLAISWNLTDKEVKEEDMFSQFSHIVGRLALDMPGFLYRKFKFEGLNGHAALLKRHLNNPTVCVHAI